MSQVKQNGGSRECSGEVERGSASSTEPFTQKGGSRERSEEPTSGSSSVGDSFTQNGGSRECSGEVERGKSSSFECRPSPALGRASAGDEQRRSAPSTEPFTQRSGSSECSGEVERGSAPSTEPFTQNPTQGMAYLAAASLSFAVMGAITHATPLPFWELTLSRGVVISLLLLPSILKQKIPLLGKNHKWLLIRSFAGTVSLITYFYSLQVITLSQASLLTFSSPIWVALLAPLVLRERFYLDRSLAVLVGFIGLVFIAGEGVFAIFSSIEAQSLGLLAGLLSGLFAGFAYMAVRRLREDHPLIVVFQFSIVSVVISLPGALLYGRWPVGVEWLAMFGIGAFATLGQYLMTLGYQRVEASAGSVANLLNPLISQVMSVFLFSEPFGTSQLIGALLVLASGVALPWIESKKRSA